MIRQQLPGVPIMALTATAAPQVCSPSTYTHLCSPINVYPDMFTHLCPPLHQQASCFLGSCCPILVNSWSSMSDKRVLCWNAVA